MADRSTGVRIAVWYHLGGGGAKRALHQHVAGLVERGHHVEVWTPSTSRVDFFPLSELCTEHVLPVDAGVLGHDQRMLPKLVRNLRTSMALSMMDAHYAEVAAAMSHGDFDVAFVNTDQFNAVPGLARHLGGLPNALYLQEPRRSSYEAQPVLMWIGHLEDDHDVALGRRVRREAREWLLRRRRRRESRAEISDAHRYDRLLVNSIFSREAVARTYGIEGHVCYLGVDTEYFTPAAAPTQAHLLGVSALIPSKRVELAIEGLAAVPEPRPPLIWVGDRAEPDYLRMLTELARARGVNLQILHSATDAELLELMRHAAAVLQPALLEPFGFTPLEAGACAVPSIAVAEGGLRETVVDGETGWLAEPTAEAFGKAVLDCLSDLAHARERGARARADVEARWGADAAVDRLEQHLRELAGAKPIRGPQSRDA